MDPDAVLAALKAASHEILTSNEIESDDFQAVLDLATEIADLFTSLDGWLSNGGFPPKAWSTVADPGDTNRG